MRKLASIQRIHTIEPIEGADAIECAKVNGWQVVVKREEFKVGDLVIYCEIDSWIPHDLAPFLSKGNEPKEYEGIKGNRLRTAKLRGCLSQGLILPTLNIETPVEGDDVSELLGIVKYDPPLPACLAGEAVGLFPSFIPKTDEERFQNMVPEVSQILNEEVYVAEKLDGSSYTAFINDGEFGVCSRNLQLRNVEGNTLWKWTIDNDVELKLRSLDRNIAIQGEIIGNGIQGNKYKLAGHDVRIFNAYDINTGKPLLYDEFNQLCGHLNFKTVPIIKVGKLEVDINDLLVYADDKSELCDTMREGVVIRTLSEPRKSFKVISNKWLLKNE